MIKLDILENLRRQYTQTTSMPRAFLAVFAKHLRACGCARRTAMVLTGDANHDLSTPIWYAEVVKLVNTVYGPEAASC